MVTTIYAGYLIAPVSFSSGDVKANARLSVASQLRLTTLERVCHALAQRNFGLAAMQRASAQQRARLASAAFNFALGVYRNVQLADEAPKVVDSVKTNPMLAMKASKLLIAAHLVTDEAQQTAGMVGSLHTIMTAGNIAVPTPSETTVPQPVDLG